jgi:thiosulfate dehydrogenase [quinone] large subunit
MRERVSLALLVPLRIYTGWVFMTAGLGKLFNHWLDRPQLASVLDGWIAEGKTYRFFVPFLRGVVLPHDKLFSVLVVVGEITVGVALLAGAFTRVTALVGFFLVTMFLLGRGDGISANSTAPFLFITLTLALTRAGRSLGLDAALAGKVPRWLS